MVNQFIGGSNVRRALQVVVLIAFSISTRLYAQSITGYSVMADVYARCTGINAVPITAPLGSTLPSVTPSSSARLPPPISYPQCPVAAQAYFDTEEDYTAAMYYNVQNVTSVFRPDGSVFQTVNVQGTSSAKGSVNQSYIALGAATDGIFTETTDHYLDLYYVVNGSYYDPYGYSLLNGGMNGDWNTGFWLNVYVYATYIAQVAVLLGETYSSLNHSTQNAGSSTGNPRRFSALLQVYIPSEWDYGNIEGGCPNVNRIYAGDNRSQSTSLGSYRAFQQLTLGVGGLTLPSQPGAQDTGYTHEYYPDSLDSNNHFLQAALASQPSPCHYLEAIGKATTAGMQRPTPQYSGGTSSTQFIGHAGNPLVSYAPAIDWNASISLSEPTTTDLKVGGAITHDCYPAFELSVGQNDVYAFTPPANDTFYIANCLAGVEQVTGLIARDFIIAP